MCGAQDFRTRLIRRFNCSYLPVAIPPDIGSCKYIISFSFSTVTVASIVSCFCRLTSTAGGS